MAITPSYSITNRAPIVTLPLLKVGKPGVVGKVHGVGAGGEWHGVHPNLESQGERRWGNTIRIRVTDLHGRVSWIEELAER